MTRGVRLTTRPARTKSFGRAHKKYHLVQNAQDRNRGPKSRQRPSANLFPSTLMIGDHKLESATAQRISTPEGPGFLAPVEEESTRPQFCARNPVAKDLVVTKSKRGRSAPSNGGSGSLPYSRCGLPSEFSVAYHECRRSTVSCAVRLQSQSPRLTDVSLHFPGS